MVVMWAIALRRQTPILAAAIFLWLPGALLVQAGLILALVLQHAYRWSGINANSCLCAECISTMLQPVVSYPAAQGVRAHMHHGAELPGCAGMAQVPCIRLVASC